MSIELWNGFCAGMSIDDVKNRGNELFGFDGEKRCFDTGTEGGLSALSPNIWSDDRVPPKWFNIIKPDTVITYGYDTKGHIPECVRDTKNAENEKIFEEKYEFIKMFFHKNILFALLINWSGDSEKVLEFAISKYGKHDKDHCWDITDKYMYIKETMVFFIENFSYEKYIEMKETEEMKKNEIKQKIDEEKRIANEGIMF